MAKTRRALDDLLNDDRAPDHLVKELVSVGFKQEDVEKWTSSRARFTLEKFRRDTSNAMSKADGVAIRNDGTTFPPPQPERNAAAEWLASSMAKTDRHEMLLAMTNALYHYAEDELLRIASYFLTRLKTIPPLPETGSTMLGRAKAAKTEGGAAPVEQGIDL